MRILAFGDVHADKSLVKRLAQKSVDDDIDIVIICGDITHFDKSTDNLIGPFKKANKKVLFVPGNHESFATADFLSSMYDIKNMHGYSARYDDIGFFGCGGANIGIAQLPENEIFDSLMLGFEKISYLNKKVMITHVHPSGTLMEKFTQFFEGSSGLRKAVEKTQPDYLLCSHVHEAEGIEEKIGRTKVMNVGKEGKVIDI